MPTANNASADAVMVVDIAGAHVASSLAPFERKVEHYAGFVSCWSGDGCGPGDLPMGERSPKWLEAVAGWGSWMWSSSFSRGHDVLGTSVLDICAHTSSTCTPSNALKESVGSTGVR